MSGGLHQYLQTTLMFADLLFPLTIIEGTCIIQSTRGLRARVPEEGRVGVPTKKKNCAHTALFAKYFGR